MKNCVVVGKPDSGKTVFTVNFAAYLGLALMDIVVKTPDGQMFCQRYPSDMAVRQLSGVLPQHAHCVHSMTVDFRYGKQQRTFQITDTCALTDEPCCDDTVRKGVAQTLEHLGMADIVFHVLDASQTARMGIHAISALDREIAQFSHLQGNYAILANKMDRSSAREGLKCIMQAFPHESIFPVSAMLRRGFKDVRGYITRFV